MKDDQKTAGDHWNDIKYQIRLVLFIAFLEISLRFLPDGEFADKMYKFLNDNLPEHEDFK